MLFFLVYSLDKDEKKRADLTTLLNHDFIKLNVLGDVEFKFLHDLVKKLKE
jgi:hypothetical protein